MMTIINLLVGILVALIAVQCVILEEARGMRAGVLDKPFDYGVKSDSGSCSYSASCTVSGNLGACVSISAGCCSGKATAGYCPGSSDIQCCTLATCSTPSGSGKCMSTSSCSATGGKSVSGYCTGPTDLQCCVSGGNTTSATGYDISAALSSSGASCFQSSGYSFAIPRGFRSTGSVDTNVCTSIKAAYNAGAKVRDTYMFPCPTCSSSAGSQMSSLVTYLNSNCKSQWSGRVWLDVEGSQYWTSSYSTNQAWYKALVESCSTYGVRCGVYSSASQWSAIFGSTSFSYGSSLPLWYAHYDDKASFSDFSSFGGWSSPLAKQYKGDVTVCSMDCDVSYAPNF